MRNTIQAGNSVLFFTVPLSALILITSAGGVFLTSTYARETTSYAAQGIAQDIFDAIILVPVLLAASLLVKRGSRSALFALLGSLLYSLYTFVLYCLGVHFNSFFLVYCAALGVSFFAIAWLLSSLEWTSLPTWFEEKTSVTPATMFLFGVVALSYFIWISEDVPAILRDEVPSNVTEVGLLTNPVHVLDLAIFLPGTFLSALLLKKRKPLGYLFAPSLIFFVGTMALSTAGMFLYSNYRGFSSDLVVPGFMFTVAAGSFLVFFHFIRAIQPNSVK